MPDATQTQVTPLEGKTTIDDKMFFEPSRLSYQSAGLIAEKIAAEVREEAQSKTVVIAGTSLLADFNNLQAVYLMLESLQRDYEALAIQAETIKEPRSRLQRERATSFEDQSAVNPLAELDVIDPATTSFNGQSAAALLAGLASGAIINPATTLLSTTLGLVSLFREDVEYHGLNTVIDPLAFELTLAAKLKAGGANEVYVPDLMAVPLSDATTGSLRARLNMVQAAKARVWAAVGPRIAESILLEAKLDQVSRGSDQKLFDELSAQVSNMRRDLQPISEPLHRSDQNLADLQNQWNQVSEPSGMSQLARLLRAEAIHAMKPLFLHAQVVSSGGHHRLSRNLFRMLFLGDGLSFAGGAIARWALMENNGSVAKGGIFAYRHTSRSRDNWVDHNRPYRSFPEEIKSLNGRLTHTGTDHATDTKVKAEAAVLK